MVRMTDADRRPMVRPESNPMLMTPSTAFESFFGAAPSYAELMGKRVLIMGVTATHGVDIARAFAEHRTRLILQIDEPSAETEALGEVLAPVAAELSLYPGALKSADEIVAFARRAISQFGGIDVVVCIVPLTLGDVGLGDLEDIEQRVSDVLLMPCLIGRVAANRMRLTQTDGLVLHVAVMPHGPTRAERAFAGAAKATLAAMTRTDAAAWAADGVRVNAVAPETGTSSGSGLAGEPDIAALALYLAAGRGTSLAGHVFEADVQV
jgi:NAD(P)-dependent dehydrogenase (short-subunit alcohol dehydrogenase family)